MSRTLECWFFRIASSILIVTAAAKLFSATGFAKILYAETWVFGLTNRELMILAAAAELGAVFVLMLARPLALRALVLLWLVSNFVIYRVGMAVTDSIPCPCLGTVTERLHLSPDLVDGILKSVIIYLFAGTLFVITYRWLEKRNVISPDREKRA